MVQHAPLFVYCYNFDCMNFVVAQCRVFFFFIFFSIFVIASFSAYFSLYSWCVYIHRERVVILEKVKMCAYFFFVSFFGCRKRSQTEKCTQCKFGNSHKVENQVFFYVYMRATSSCYVRSVVLALFFCSQNSYARREYALICRMLDSLFFWGVSSAK